MLPSCWHPDRLPPEQRDAYLPFSAGRHRCAGDHYALHQLTLLIAAVLTRLHLHPSTNHPIRPHVGTVERPQQLLMTPTPR
ncbi:cytochrome P450 [Streptomyces sp. NPDC048370]|uniref:cytochrome P450 n=1 Tax=Streptomyces sp. NPDC048370 TaxID=3365540 RepID=UPI003720D937